MKQQQGGVLRNFASGTRDSPMQWGRKPARNRVDPFSRFSKPVEIVRIGRRIVPQQDEIALRGL